MKSHYRFEFYGSGSIPSSCAREGEIPGLSLHRHVGLGFCLRPRGGRYTDWKVLGFGLRACAHVRVLARGKG